MRDQPINYFNYFTEIEEHFVLKRGKHILLSPLDWTLMETWQGMGIPLHVVLRGIDRAMDLFAARQVRQRFVNSLCYCNQAVLEEHEAHLLSLEGAASTAESGEGAEPPPAPRAAADSLRRFLARRHEEMAQLGRRYPGTAVEEAAQRVSARLAAVEAELADGARIDPERLEADLSAMDEVLLPALEGSLGKEELAALRASCQEELKHHRRNLGKEMYVRILRNFLRKRIKEHFGVTDLSLLDVQWH